MSRKILIQKNCPCCGTEDTRLYKKIQDFPAILFPVKEGLSKEIVTGDILSRKCNICNHIYLEEINLSVLSKIYNEYYVFYPFADLETFNKPYRTPFEKVQEFFILEGNSSLLEIGTSSPEHLMPFYRKGLKCTAVNPEVEYSDTITMVKEFYENWNTEEKFDYIISRFNLEHIIDLDAFFDKIKTQIAEDGILLIQVPNASNYVNSGSLNIMAHEHIHYFNASSIRSLLDRMGFELRYISSETDPSIVVVAEMRKILPMESATINHQAVLKSIETLLLDSTHTDVLYGAGLSATAILYSSNLPEDILSNIILVDDNVAIGDKVMPKTNNAIYQLKDLKNNQSYRFFLTLNEMYHQKVIEKIMDHFPLSQIFIIGKNGLVRYQ